MQSNMPGGKKVTCAALLLAWAVAGCSQLPSRIDPPAFDAEGAGEEAIATYDQDADGRLSGDELKKCPGILAAMDKFDTDGDASVTAEEIAQRIGDWGESGIGITSVSFIVMMDGEPFVGARAELEPEPFLGPGCKKAVGIVRATGNVYPSADASDLPDGVRSGMVFGIYKVKITHPDQTVPARYNTNTELGIEAGHDFDLYNLPTLALKSK
jgi:hypothetical protein